MVYTLRAIKSCMVVTIALFFSVVSFDNVIDHQTNLAFVEHVVSMDTTFHAPSLMQRAITSINVQKFIYYLIVIWQIMTAILCWFGAVAMIARINDNNVLFHESKSMAFVGMFMGFMLYMVGFIVLGGEWFSMWQSPTWNGQSKANLYLTMVMLVMIFVNTRDNE